MFNTTTANPLMEIAFRIREMREIIGYSTTTMAELVDLPEETYLSYESGEVDIPFTFIHKCSLTFGVELTELMEGRSAKLSGYTVTRRGKGPVTAAEDGITIQNMAAMFQNKLATPYWCTYQYDESLLHQPIHTVTHAGQEFDLILQGTLRIRIGEHEETLHAGDSIYYKSSTPHGMIALDGADCVFLAMIMASTEREQWTTAKPMIMEHRDEPMLCREFITAEEDNEGRLHSLNFKNTERFNFAFDVVDAIADRSPDKLAMIHLDNRMTERRYSFKDMKDASNRTANYFTSLGIRRGDRVLLSLRRRVEFWYSILALHKIGAIAVPATHQLMEHDFAYRFSSAEISAVICTSDGDTARQIELAEGSAPKGLKKILVGGSRPGWQDFNSSYLLFSRHYDRTDISPCGSDPMLMFFTSGTTGYPKIVEHDYRYALGHYVTAKYWHWAESGGLHFTISDTGWGKALWGKLYGQWMCESAVFVYDFDRFSAEKILPLFAKYNITTFCAPPTMYRMLIRQKLADYDLSSIRHATTAGEALNPEVFVQFEKATGLQIAEGFGQTEMTLGIANLAGEPVRPGSMGKPVPGYGIDLIDPDGRSVEDGVSGEIVIRPGENGELPCGIFMGYLNDEESQKEAWRGGCYHTGDVAWRDEDGFFWYVGRVDDVIKSSGYRIGPLEIENVIMELPYVLECGVSAVPDEVRGQIVKASIVLLPGTEGTEELKTDIQNYVKTHTAPYKYPRIVEFRTELPKTISGKIIRREL